MNNALNQAATLDGALASVGIPTTDARRQALSSAVALQSEILAIAAVNTVTLQTGPETQGAVAIKSRLMREAADLVPAHCLVLDVGTPGRGGPNQDKTGFAAPVVTRHAWRLEPASRAEGFSARIVMLGGAHGAPDPRTIDIAMRNLAEQLPALRASQQSEKAASVQAAMIASNSTNPKK